MGKSDYEYLDEERKKLWYKINSLETELSGRIDQELAKIPEDYVNESKQATRKTSEYRNKSEESKNVILQHLTEAEGKLIKINGIADSVEGISQKVAHETTQANLNNVLISNILSDVRANESSIGDDVLKLTELFEDFDTMTDKLSKLQEIVAESYETSSKIETLHKALLIRKTEIDKIYYDIFGYTEGEGSAKTQVNGLKDTLNKAYDDLTGKINTTRETVENLENRTRTDYNAILVDLNDNIKQNIQNWDIKYYGLEHKIEALLPKALTAGLSYAYSEKKTAEIEEYKKLNWAFMLAIGGLILVSSIPFIVSMYSLYHDKPFEKVLYDMPRAVLSILPLYIPVLWVAYSSNRKMNLSKRLSEEYSHKEVLSKTFEGLSTQISNISDEKVSAELKNKLLYNILEVSSENPGKLISDYNKSDHPLMDALDKSVKLAVAFEKLEKIPGFSKLADKINKKSKLILKEERDKANQGLDSVGDEDE